MAARFKQFMVSDSDEDSGDSAVIERREERSNGAASARATPPPAAAPPTQPTAAAPAAMPPQSAAGSVRHATPRNDSVASSRPIALEPGSRVTPVPGLAHSGSTDATSIDFNVLDTASRRGPAAAADVRSASQQSLTFDVLSSNANPPTRGDSVLAVPVPRAAAAGSAPRTPASVPLFATTAPRQESTPSINFAVEATPVRTASHANGTPRESSDGSVGVDGQRRKKVVRRKVVMRRRKGADPGEPGEVVRADDAAIPPGRSAAGTPLASAASLPGFQPPPPGRVSPRAVHAAASRSASRANTPAQTPRTPRANNGDAVPPLSARSQQSDARPLVPPRSHRHSSRQATPRTPLSHAAKAESPIVFEAAQDTETVNFHLEDTTARTDDTISFKFDDGTTPRRAVARSGAYPQRHPQIPSPSALDDGPTPMTTDGSGQQVMMHRAKVRLTRTADGRQAWMLFSPRLGEGAAAPLQEIPAPPKRLSQRAQDILAAKRRAVEDDAKKRHAETVKRAAAPQSLTSPVFFEEVVTDGSPAPTESERRRPAAARHSSSKRLSIARRARVHFAFPPAAFYTEATAQRHAREAQSGNDAAWTRHSYGTAASCAGVLRASAAPLAQRDAERVVRALQPVQTAPTDAATGTCGCVVYDTARDDALRLLISNRSVRDEGVRRYLNLQPMQLASVEMQDMVDPPLESPAEVADASGTSHPAAADGRRGVATLGGLWCTAEALRDDGRPVIRKESAAPRRILRICGGQALGVPLRPDGGASLDVRCYELLLFPREALSPSAVNYGSDGLTLGQLIAPPASSFPLTPRIVDDPVALKEHRKRLLSTKNRQVAMVNNEDDRETFTDASGATLPGQYLTLTMVTISSRQKYTVELTLVLLPFRSSGIHGGKTVAEVPRFCPTTVMTYRRLQGLALSFSTKSAFLSAYKALLWATECDIVDVQPGDGEEDAASAGLGYSRLRVCATSSPMVPWVSSFGRPVPGQPREETFHGNCLDFAVLTLAAPAAAVQRSEPEPREPLTLEDFVMADGEGADERADGDDGARSEASGATSRQQRRSSIFTSTLAPAKKAFVDGDEAEEGGGASANAADTVVGLTAYGVIRRAVSQKTSEVFDVRVMPRNRGRMAPTYDAAADAEWREAGGQTVKAKQEHLLQQDVEAAIMMEYASRLPFHSRVYGVLVDEQRYYIFQEPWISALSLEQSVSGSTERDAVEYNAKLKSMTQSTAVMSLKDFTHAILRPGEETRGMKEEVRLELAHVLAAQLLLLIASLHGKGMLLGPCPPQRVLVRIENADKAAEEEEEESVVDTPDRAKARKAAPRTVQSSSIQLFVPDLGVNTLAWGYERQQCGVLEYLPPMYVLEQMLSESIGKEERAWTTHDDWWTYLTLCFELFASDGSALVAPRRSPPVPTPTPTLTKFFSPVDVLDVWHDIVSDADGGVAGTAAETVAVRVRRYVHQRVLRSVSRSLDSWVSTKAEEVEYFGTTGARRGRRVVRAVPPRSSSPSRTIGVSLAAAYLQSARDVSETSSIAFETEDGEQAAENVLEAMPWVFQVRDFFDAVLDAVFARGSCAVHGPALGLVSHPFFRGLSLPQVFDGTHVFTPAASLFARRQLTKPKVQAALLAYRTRAYRGPMAVRPEMPLMITGTAYNAAGGANGGAPLLMLSSPAYRDEEAAASRRHSRAEGVDPAEGLVFSRTNSMAQGMGGGASVRSQSPSSAPWSQQKLRAMYDPTEWQSIAALETEVRGALSTHGPRESVSSRRASAEADYPSNPVTISNRPTHRDRRRSGGALADTASVASSERRRRHPREYEEVVDSRPNPQRQVHTAGDAHHGNVVSVMPEAARRQPGASATSEEDADAYRQAAPQRETYNSHPTYWRDGPQSEASDREVTLRSQRDHRHPPPPPQQQQPRPARRHTDTREMEQTLHDLAARHATRRQGEREPRRHHRRSSDDTHTSDRGAPQPPPQQQGSRPSSRHSQRQHGSRPSSRHSQRQSDAGARPAWPDQFLDSATLQKKGQPQRLADPQAIAADQLTIDMQTQQSLRSFATNSHRGADNVRIFHESSSEESFVLVPSDGEDDASHGFGSERRSSGAHRQSPVPRNPQESIRGENASARDNYFSF